MGAIALVHVYFIYLRIDCWAVLMLTQFQQVFVHDPSILSRPPEICKKGHKSVRIHCDDDGSSAALDMPQVLGESQCHCCCFCSCGAVLFCSYWYLHGGLHLNFGISISQPWGIAPLVAEQRLWHTRATCRQLSSQAVWELSHLGGTFTKVW